MNRCNSAYKLHEKSLKLKEDKEFRVEIKAETPKSEKRGLTRKNRILSQQEHRKHAKGDLILTTSEVAAKGFVLCSLKTEHA